MELTKAMDEIAELNDKGGKGTEKLQGKTYTKVAARVEVFRKHLGLSLGIETEVLFPIKGVMMIARVKDKEGFVLGSGHAYAESLGKDKSLEKLESVAVGRALASLGLIGGEYATDSEVETWPERYEDPKESTTTTKFVGNTVFKTLTDKNSWKKKAAIEIAEIDMLDGVLNWANENTKYIEALNQDEQDGLNGLLAKRREELEQQQFEEKVAAE